MSDCRNGGRLFYPREMKPVREYDQAEPIRGRILWDDGQETLLTYGRVADGRERTPVLVELDGRAFAPRDADERWELEGGKVVAVSFGNARFARLGWRLRTDDEEWMNEC